MTSNFLRYSQYYDLFYKDKNYKAEADYVIEQLRPYLPVEADVLELGCGTGGHAEPFCQAGYRVTGIDRSEEMIRQAKEKRIPNFSTLLADITSFSLPQQFDGAFSLFHVISYLTTNAMLAACFKTVAYHLKPGGVFCFDCWYGPAVIHELPATRIRKIIHGELELTRTAKPVLHIEQNVVEVQYDIQIDHTGNKESEGVQETHFMRYFTIPEIEWIAEQTGFKVLKAEEFMTSENTTLNTWNLFVLLQKK
ncbi:MAG: class I SAM-dependent methyltransferase [Williamsia sp.]|nr:class I SAM-dependent methyltransferase [Williamsia sp.]